MMIIARRVLFLLIFLLIAVTSLAAGFPAVQIYEQQAPQVVLIIAGSGGKGGMIGSGVIIKPGLILTNAHIVIDAKTDKGYSKINCYLKPDQVTGKMSSDLGKRVEGHLIAFDSKLDLAVIKIAPSHFIKNTFVFAPPSATRVGEEVVAIGHPEQGGLWTLSYGRISGVIRNQLGVAGRHVYQTDASVNRGNSGGPLINRQGHLVGIITSAARVGYDNMPITGVNFAIKASVAKEWLDKNGIIIVYGNLPTDPESKPNLETDMPRNNKGSRQKTADVPSVKASDKPSSRSPITSIDDEKQNKPQGGTILTEKRPYSEENLWKVVEKDMEDILHDMRRRTR